MPVARTRDELADAIRATLISPNVAYDNLESPNVVDVLDKIARALTWLAGGNESSKSPLEIHGEYVNEAAETIAFGLHDIANAIRETMGDPNP